MTVSYEESFIHDLYNRHDTGRNNMKISFSLAQGGLGQAFMTMIDNKHKMGQHDN
jgi:hypothetical protein